VTREPGMKIMALLVLISSNACMTSDQVVSGPEASADGITYERGRITVLAVPQYAAAAGDEINTLFHISSAPYGAPSLSLVESDRLSLTLTYSNFTSVAVSLPYRAAVWKPGDSVELTAIWDTTGREPFIALSIDGEVAGARSVEPEPGLAGEQHRLFVGRQWDDALHEFTGSVQLISSAHAPGATLAGLAAGAAAGPASGIEPSRPGSGAAAGLFSPESGIRSPDSLVMTHGEQNGLPPVGQWQSVHGYGTRIMRVTTDSEQGGFATQIYSQLQAFSPNGEYVLITSNQGYRVVSFPSGDVVQLSPQWWNAPRWDPSLPHHIVAYDSNDDLSLGLVEVDVASGRESVRFSFPERFQRIVGSRSFDSLSRDGRWIAGLAITNRGREVFALDLHRGVLGAAVLLDELQSSGGRCDPDPQYGVMEPDWIGVSPSGRHLVVQWVRDWSRGSGACSGLEAWSLSDGSFHGRIANGHAHGDLGLLSDGSEVFFTVSLQSPEDPNRPAVVYHELPEPVSDTAVRTSAPAPRFLRTVPWGAAAHLSAKGPAGVVLIGSGAFDPATGRLERTPREPFLQELALIFEDRSVIRLGQTRTSSCGYWAQARATLSPDGRFVAFASDWFAGTGITGCSDAQPLGAADLYVLQIR
jgi:hypothetical protein